MLRSSADSVEIEKKFSDPVKQDLLYEKARKLQTAHVWISLFFSIINFFIVFIYLHSLLHSLQAGNMQKNAGSNVGLDSEGT